MQFILGNLLNILFLFSRTGSEFVRVFGDSKSVYLVSKSGADKYCVQKKSQTSATSSRECHTVDKSLPVEISQTQNQIVLQNEKTTIAVNKADIKQKNSFVSILRVVILME